jgi:hypothetical protein
MHELLQVIRSSLHNNEGFVFGFKEILGLDLIGIIAFDYIGHILVLNFPNNLYLPLCALYGILCHMVVQFAFMNTYFEGHRDCVVAFKYSFLLGEWLLIKCLEDATLAAARDIIGYIHNLTAIA